jgi:hypothetical protein
LVAVIGGRIGRSDAKLDVVAVFMAGLIMPREYQFAGSPHAPLDEQFQISWAALILPEAMVECVIEPIQAEVMCASGISSIQERTVDAAI